MIIMPQTPGTITTTAAPMVKRRIALTAGEEAIVLGLVRTLIERRNDGEYLPDVHVGKWEGDDEQVD